MVKFHLSVAAVGNRDAIGINAGALIVSVTDPDGNGITKLPAGAFSMSYIEFTNNGYDLVKLASQNVREHGNGYYTLTFVLGVVPASSYALTLSVFRRADPRTVVPPATPPIVAEGHIAFNYSPS